MANLFDHINDSFVPPISLFELLVDNKIDRATYFILLHKHVLGEIPTEEDCRNYKISYFKYNTIMRKKGEFIKNWEA